MWGLRQQIGTLAQLILRPHSEQLPKNESDSKYQLQGEIARGGMGAILRGRDKDLGRDLAVKVLLDEHKQKPAVIQRFVEEAQIGGQLQHPGIVPVYELGQFEDDRPFFTMKLVKGQTLAALLEERSAASDDRVRFLGIFEQICQTMAYAHSHGVIHRDLKPSNIMVGAFGEVQVMDWGLAKVLSAGGVADEKRAFDNLTKTSIIQTIRSLGSDTPDSFGSVTAGSRTQMGSVMGTPAYMPPEQALGEIDRLDQTSDVFGLGAILCEILTGEPPYTGEDHTEVFRKASRAKLEECHARLEASQLDSELLNVVRSTLEPEPEDRPRDAGKLSERISAYLESVETRLRESELERATQTARAVEERKRRKIILALCVSTLVTCIIAGGAWVVSEQKDAALAKMAAEQKVEKLIESQQASQRIAQEIASARALAKLDETELAEAESVARALEAIGRANEAVEDSEASIELHEQLQETETLLLALQADHQLVADLESARNLEFEQSQGYSSSGVPYVVPVAAGGVDSKAEKENQPGKALDGLQAYEQAFATWGLGTGENTDEVAKKFDKMHPKLRASAVYGLERWLNLTNHARPIGYWQDKPWVLLDLIRADMKGWGKLESLPDGILRSRGRNWNAPYDLVFRNRREMRFRFATGRTPRAGNRSWSG